MARGPRRPKKGRRVASFLSDPWAATTLFIGPEHRRQALAWCVRVFRIQAWAKRLRRWRRLGLLENCLSRGYCLGATQFNAASAPVIRTTPVGGGGGAVA